MSTENKKSKLKSSVKQTAKKVTRKKTSVRKTSKTASKVDGGSKLTGELSKKTQVVKKATPVSRNKKESKEEDAVTLPDNAALRVVEKSKVLQYEFDRYFGSSVRQLAYVGALCFMLVGGALVVSDQNITRGINHNLSAEVITASSTESGGDDVVQIPDPKFDLLTDIPDILIDRTFVRFIVTDAEEIVVKLKSVESSVFIELGHQVVSEYEYVTVIPFDQLNHTYYDLLIYVQPANGSEGTVFQAGEFHVGEIIEELSPENKEVVEEETGTTTEDVITDIVEEDEPDSEEVIEDGGDGSENVVTEDSADPTEDSEPEVEVDQESEDIVFDFRLESSESLLSDVVLIEAIDSSEFSFIELYAERVGSSRREFVTLAHERFGRWVFRVDTKTLPNGEYDFVAKAKYSGDSYRTSPIRLRVYNDVLAVETSSVVLADEVSDPAADEDSPNTLAVDDPDDESFTDEEFVYTEGGEEEFISEIEEVLYEHSDELSELLQQYARAEQLDDDLAIESIEGLLAKKQLEIVLQTQEEEGSRNMAEELELAKSIHLLQKKATLFEELKESRSTGEDIKDTDEDGISDDDEIKLYHTDPTVADTDGDGVPDGLELESGSDPVDAEPTAVIVFASPKQSIGLTRESVFVVEEVLPAAVSEGSDLPLDTIVPEIRGRGLPNSFVTLYIFSTPTVVTVKTDADGLFVYTFDKELADGQHDVYVAMTDNKGSIVAQSKPFTFIKEAQAFTPIDAEAAEVFADTSVDLGTETPEKMYNTVIGVGVLALGVILLMLGLSLRPKEEDDELVETIMKDNTDNE